MSCLMSNVDAVNSPTKRDIPWTYRRDRKYLYIDAYSSLQAWSVHLERIHKVNGKKMQKEPVGVDSLAAGSSPMLSGSTPL